MTTILDEFMILSYKVCKILKNFIPSFWLALVAYIVFIKMLFILFLVIC